MIKTHRDGAYLFKAIAYTWLGIANFLAIATYVADVLGNKEGGYILAGLALLALLVFFVFFIVAGQLASTADELEEVARRISHPFYPAAPRSSRHRWKV